MSKSYILPKFISLLFIIGIFHVIYKSNFVQEKARHIISYRNKKLSISKPTPIPTLPIIRLSPTQVISPTQSFTDDTTEWGKAQKIDDVTYTIKVGYDSQMTGRQELIDALNSYRSVNGRGALTHDEKLSQYAQSRAEYFTAINDTDKHAGFNHFLENENGFQTLGFRRVGENSYFGGKLNGVHLIEWVFAQSPGHNANQIDGGWSHIGVGITDTSVNIIFGGDKI